MTETPQNDKNRHQISHSSQEPGLLESIGSFPVWLLKIIDIITPGFLIRESSPKKEKPKD